MKIEVNGVQVEVGEDFANLSDEQKQATVNEIAASLKPAVAASEEESKEPAVVSEMWPTIGGAVTGAIKGSGIGKSAKTGMEAAKAATVPQGAGGEKWLRNWAGMERPGTKGVPEAAQIYERAKTHGQAGQKVWQKFGNQPLDINRFSEAAAAERRASSLPSQIGRSAKEIGKEMARPSPYRFLGGALAGGLTGYDAARAWNQYQEGDIPGAIISGVGALGGGLSFIPHPVTRYGGMALSGGAALADYLRQRNKEKASVMEGYASGGLAHLAGGSQVGKGAVNLAKKFGYNPKKVASQYPEVLPGVLTTDPKSGKEFLKKALSPEAEAVQKARKAAQGEIDKGQYSPFFDVTKRSYVNPQDYPLTGRTLTDIVPKKAETVEKYRLLAESPEATARLKEAFARGSQAPAAKDWYAMKQLEDAFVQELGPEAGKQAFRQRFAEPMAATTGGADPTSNLMMTAYTNFMREKGLPIPTAASELPFPIGGRYVSGNMEQARRYHEAGSIPVDNPKRHNFASNFMGYRDRPTIDEQMMGLFAPGKGAPEPGTYGVYEAALNKLAKQEGVNPVNFQDVAWAGAKEYHGKPMIEEINQMIYRTSRVTGEKPEDVLKGFIRGNKPMYGFTGLGSIGLQETGGINNPD